MLATVFFFATMPASAAVDAAAPTAPRPEPAATPPAGPPPDADDVPRIQCFTRHEESQVSRRGGRLIEAREALRSCSREACPSAIRADCVEWLEQIERSIPSVVVTARDRALDLPDVRVLVDGRVAADRLTGVAIELDPGEHRFRFESPGRPSIERTVLLSEGVKQRPIDVDFSPEPPPAPRGAPMALQQPGPAAAEGLSMFDYVAGSVAVAALGTAAFFGGWGLLSRNQLERDCGHVCPDSEREAVENRLLVADVALGTAVLSLAFLFLHRLSVSRVAPQARPGAASLDIGVRGVF